MTNRTCTVCGGKGKCLTCSGTGRHPQDQDRACPICGTTGCCVLCHGTGLGVR